MQKPEIYLRDTTRITFVTKYLHDFEQDPIFGYDIKISPPKRGENVRNDLSFTITRYGLESVDYPLILKIGKIELPVDHLALSKESEDRRISSSTALKVRRDAGGALVDLLDKIIAQDGWSKPPSQLLILG